MKKHLLISILSIITFSAALFPDVASAQYIQLYNFKGSPDGSSPVGPLISDGIYLYGTTQNGGFNDWGTIFKIKPDGTGYVKLMEFGTTLCGGKCPCAALAFDGNYLYGMTSFGGRYNSGTIFKINLDGTNYTKLMDFAGDINGGMPSTYASIISDSYYLYGMTSGGANGTGTVFKIKHDGTGYDKIYDFTDSGTPYGSLISNRYFLYGMTTFGGTYSLGSVFKIDLDNYRYTKLLDFDGASNGSMPYGSLMLKDTFLYGMTNSGGTYDLGTAFKIKSDGSSYVKLLDFDSVKGINPMGALISDNIFLYGMTIWGGINSMGTVFKIKFDGTGFVKIFDFSYFINGFQPRAALYSDGTFLYGMAGGGGTYEEGVIFRLDTNATVGIEELTENNRIDIYPNPSSNNLFVESPQLSLLEISNLQGQTILQQRIQGGKSDIDISRLAKGIYILKLVSLENMQVTKFVKE